MTGVPAGAFRRVFDGTVFAFDVHPDRLVVVGFEEQQAMAALAGERVPERPGAIAEAVTVAVRLAGVELTVRLAERLVELGCARVHELVRAAQDPATPHVALAFIGIDSLSPAVRVPVIEHPATPTGVLGVLAEDESVVIRSMVAGSGRAPLAVAARLTVDESDQVRESLARTSTTPRDVLGVLAGDGSVEVRRWVARNLSTPVQMLRGLAEDPDPEVRGAVVTNRVSPAWLVERLAEDPDGEVRALVDWRLARP